MNFKMKVIIATAVVSCLLVVASAQNCVQRAQDVTNCAASLTNPDVDIQDFCNRCGNTLIRYYNDCLNGAGVDAVKQGMLERSY